MINRRQYCSQTMFLVCSKFRVILSCLLTTALVAGCISSEQTTKDITLEEPRSTGGIMVKGPQDDTLEQLVEKLEIAREGRDPGSTPDKDPSYPVPKSDLRALQRHSDLESAEHLSWATGMGFLVNLPRLSKIELSELGNDLALSLRTEHGYEDAEEEK